MPLTLRVLSGQRKQLGDEQRMQIGPEGATIGRSLDNDWVLPDANRYVSSRHATVDFQGAPSRMKLLRISLREIPTPAEFEVASPEPIRRFALQRRQSKRRKIHYSVCRPTYP